MSVSSLYRFRATGGAAQAGSFTKSAGAHFRFSLHLRGLIPAGKQVSRATATATDLGDNSNQTATVLQSTNGEIVNGEDAEFTVRAGTAQHRYKLVISWYDNTGNLYPAEQVLMVVKA
jgi:hypothetical protein